MVTTHLLPGCLAVVPARTLLYNPSTSRYREVQADELCLVVDVEAGLNRAGVIVGAATWRVLQSYVEPVQG